MKKKLVNSKNTRGEKVDVYQLITDRIIDQLEAGVVPWRKPWTGDANGAYNYMTGRRYSLLNQMLLQHEGAYLTWNQIKSMGGTVKKRRTRRKGSILEALPRKGKGRGHRRGKIKDHPAVEILQRVLDRGR
jgi:antirestriction protein ArdC